MKPWACDNEDVTRDYKELASSYAKKGGFEYLARHYLWNIANAHFAWRNRYQTDHMRVEVEFNAGRKIAFDPMQLNLEKPASPQELSAAVIPKGPATLVDDLIACIAQGLSTEGKLLHVAWYARMEEGRRCFRRRNTCATTGRKTPRAASTQNFPASLRAA
jgi:CRISPR-associated protein Csy3